MPLDRRELLGSAIAFGGVLALPRFLRADEPARAAPRRTIVLLHLNGGNDGLNTVVPYADPAYRRLRPGLAVDAGQVRRLSDGLGLHPALAGLEALWKRERLAVVNGVGYPQPNFSHFRATEIWQTAEPERAPNHGWIGRALAASARQAPLRAVALEKEQPLALASPVPGVVTLTRFDRFRVPSGMEDAASLYGASVGEEGMRAEAGRAGAEALAVARRIAGLSPRGRGLNGRLGEDLAKALALLEADLHLDCIHLSQGGYDTHSNQAQSHPRLLTELGRNLDAFQREIEERKIDGRVVVVVYSEFGRRASENLSGGTDHGSAGPVFVIGSGLRAGLHGAVPSLADLDDDNLRFTTDFRRLYASLLTHALETDPAPVLGEFEPLELFA